MSSKTIVVHFEKNAEPAPYRVTIGEGSTHAYKNLEDMLEYIKANIESMAAGE